MVRVFRPFVCAVLGFSVTALLFVVLTIVGELVLQSLRVRYFGQIVFSAVALAFSTVIWRSWAR
jgi:hypothetical protein